MCDRQRVLALRTGPSQGRWTPYLGGEAPPLALVEYIEGVFPYLVFLSQEYLSARPAKRPPA